MIKLAEDQTVNVVGQRHYLSTARLDRSAQVRMNRRQVACVPSVFSFVPTQKQVISIFNPTNCIDKLQQSPDLWFQKAHQSVNTLEQQNKSRPLI